MESQIPLFATRPALEPLLAQIAERQRAVLESGRYILGPEVEAFEAEFAAYVGRRHCVGVANGTDALTIGLRSLGVERGDEVVVPALTFYATAEAVLNAGATPVFADVDPATRCVTAASVEAVLSERTAAIVPVHLFGNPAPMGALGELAAAQGLRLLEDAAQAAGATIDGRHAGGLGDAAAFSFYPSKNLGGTGDGGALLTDDDEVAAAARRLRFHGSEDKRIHTEVGYNSRLDELQAAGLRVVLPKLDEWVAARRVAAAAYAERGLGDFVELGVETPGASSAHHLYVIATQGRDQLAEALAAKKIGARAYYTVPLHRQPALEAYAGADPLPSAERLAAEGLALPMGPSLAIDDVARVVEAIASALAR